MKLLLDERTLLVLSWLDKIVGCIFILLKFKSWAIQISIRIRQTAQHKEKKFNVSQRDWSVFKSWKIMVLLSCF